MLACRSQIPAIHSSPACDSPNEDDENKHICIICISSEAKLGHQFSRCGMAYLNLHIKCVATWYLHGDVLGGSSKDIVPFCEGQGRCRGEMSRNFNFTSHFPHE